MTESTRKNFTDHNIEKSNTHRPYCLVCGTSIEHHPTLLLEEEIHEDYQWYLDRAEGFEFYPFVHQCVMCDQEAFYVGVTSNGTPFEFCRQHRDELKRLKDTKNFKSERDMNRVIN